MILKKERKSEDVVMCNVLYLTIVRCKYIHMHSFQCTANRSYVWYMYMNFFMIYYEHARKTGIRNGTEWNVFFTEFDFDSIRFDFFEKENRSLYGTMLIIKTSTILISLSLSLSLNNKLTNAFVYIIDSTD